MRALVTDGTGLLGKNLVRALPPHEKQPHWHAGAIYRNIVTKYGHETGINIFLAIMQGDSRGYPPQG